jgi:beta-galactosidase
MSSGLTRRDFLSGAAKAGVVSALNIDMTAQQAAETNYPPRRSSFDSDWKFFLGDPEGAQSPDFNDNDWRLLDLPHDWSIEGTFSQGAPAAGTGAYLPTGIGWYRKQFLLPAGTSGKRVTLQFDGVYQRSEVWINGKSKGMRPNGFISFTYDVTAYLSAPGTANHLAVRVDNSLQPNCRWYTGSGIYRHTWLVMTDPIHIAPWGTGAPTRGVPTSYAASPLSKTIADAGELPPVWPYADGKVRGYSFAPLHKNVPQAALADERLYELLALVDALRNGRARERMLASQELTRRLEMPADAKP